MPSNAFALRPAGQNDLPDIHHLIRAARINPTGLDWRRFVVAVTPQDELIGCGQLKPHRDGSMELASIAVAPARRGEGVARAIIEHLLESHPGSLYLTCRASLGGLYEKFGFRAIDEEQMPPYFRRASRLIQVLGKLNLAGEGLLVMKRG